MTKCDHCKRDAATFIRYSGAHLCAKHFCDFFEKRVKREVRKQMDAGRTARRAKKNLKIAVALSGGKDSTVALVMLQKIFQDSRDITLYAILVDEGISGYRPCSIDIARKNCKKLGVPLHIVKFRDYFGFDMDEIVRLKAESATSKGPNSESANSKSAEVSGSAPLGKTAYSDKVNSKNVGGKSKGAKTKGTKSKYSGGAKAEKPVFACTYCGVLRRACLNRKAKELGADYLATGHNLDDVSQSILMNIFKGDVEKLARLGPHNKVQPGLIPRLEPLRSIPENEVYLYAALNKIAVHEHEHCPYAGAAQRNDYKSIIFGMEKITPGTRHSILATYDGLKDAIQASFPPSRLSECPSCGEPTSQKVCKACLLKNEIKGLKNKKE